MLVTGAGGFIGGALARILREAHADVHAAPPRAVCDLADPAACRNLIRDSRPDVVFQLAGHPFGARDLSRVIPTFRDNLAASVYLMTAAAESGVPRVVLAGSLEAPQDDAGVPSSPYAASKGAAEAYAAMFHRLFAFPAVVARLFMVYGPGQRDHTKLIPSCASALLRGEAPRVTSGERGVDWIYIDDAVNGLLTLGAAPAVEGCTVDIGTGVLTAVREVVERLVRLVPGAPTALFGAVPPRPDEQVRAARADETRRLIGWSARVALDEGLARTVEWLRQTSEAEGELGHKRGRA